MSDLIVLILIFVLISFCTVSILHLCKLCKKMNILDRFSPPEVLKTASTAPFPLVLQLKKSLIVWVF